MTESVFLDIPDDCQQKILGGIKNPSEVYSLGTTNYGQFKKERPAAAAFNGNPSVVYVTESGLTNYGQAK